MGADAAVRSGAATKSTSAADAATEAAGGARPGGGLRLTGRGAMLAVFGLCFLGLVVSDWLHWGVLAGGSFVAASGFAAARTQRGDLLTVAVSPPALFLLATICAKALVSPGSLLLSMTEGTLITLANTAPWLIAGTVLCLIITFSRGMWDNVRVLTKELRGDPIRKPADK